MKVRQRKEEVAHMHLAGFLRYYTSNGAVGIKRTSPVITHQPRTQPLKYYPASLLFHDTFSNRGPWWKLTEDLLQRCLLSWVKGVAEELKGKYLCLIYIQPDWSKFSCSLLHGLDGGIGSLQYSGQYSEPVYNGKWDEKEILSFIHRWISDEAMTTEHKALKHAML